MANPPTKKMLLDLANPGTPWKKFEAITQAFLGVFFTPHTAPHVIEDPKGVAIQLPAACTDYSQTNLTTKKGGMKPDTAVVFGDGNKLVDSKGREFNSLLCMEPTRHPKSTLKKKGGYLQEKFEHALNLSESFHKRKAGLTPTGKSMSVIADVIGKAFPSTPAVDSAKPEIPIVIVITLHEEANIKKIFSEFLTHNPMPSHCTKLGTHGIEIQDSSNNPIGYFGCLSLGAWIDACSTILAFEGCTTAQRDSAVERLVYELTSNAFGEANSGFLIEKTGTPWGLHSYIPSTIQQGRPTSVSLQSGAVFECMSFFDVDAEDFRSHCIVPRTVRQQENLQRVLDVDHLKRIGSSLDFGKQMPGTITLYSPQPFSKSSGKAGYEVTNTSPYSLEVIDGQHRLFGTYFTTKKDVKLNVLIYAPQSGTDAEKLAGKAEIFYDINYRALPPKKELALYYLSEFDDLPQGWVTKNVTNDKDGPSDKIVPTASILAYKFLLALNQNHPFKNLIVDRGIGAPNFRISTIQGYIQAFFDVGLKPKGTSSPSTEAGPHSLRVFSGAKARPDAAKLGLGKTAGNWHGLPPNHSKTNTWIRDLANEFSNYVMEVGPSTWYGSKPYTSLDEGKIWRKTRGITSTEASKTNVEKIRDWVDKTPDANFIPTLFFCWAYRISTPDHYATPSQKARHTESKLALSDPALSLSLAALKAEISKPSIWGYKGLDGIVYPFTQLCNAWNSKLASMPVEQYHVSKFKTRSVSTGASTVPCANPHPGTPR